MPTSALSEEPSDGVTLMIVDDDPTVREILTDYFVHAGYEVHGFGDGRSAIAQLNKLKPRLVILDLMLPGIDGWETCRRMRAEIPELLVLMLSARGEAEDRVLGLEVGADDYVAKPFSPRELVLRVKAMLRRSNPEPVVALTEPTYFSSAGIEVDVRARRACRDGQELNLTMREFDLLLALISTPHRVWNRSDLLHQVWGWDFGDAATVTVHVRRLREKIEPDPANPSLIATIWGLGYRWEADHDA